MTVSRGGGCGSTFSLYFKAETVAENTERIQQATPPCETVICVIGPMPWRRSCAFLRVRDRLAHGPLGPREVDCAHLARAIGVRTAAHHPEEG